MKHPSVTFNFYLVTVASSCSKPHQK